VTGADRYASLRDGPEVERRVRGSRFVGQAFALDAEQRSAELVAAIARRTHDATHHCWAYRAGSPGALVERSDDDGEPSGTAGLPILGALKREELVAALVVVTRWFGGVKLGTGGLARAYGDAAREAISAAPRRTLERLTELTLGCAYDDLGAVEAALARHEGRVRAVRRDFGEQACLDVLVLRGAARELEDALREATAGRVRVEVRGAGLRTT
jgi:uncharacterized YigZ family protein